MTDYMLVASALLPALVLCVYIYKKDRAEKEPVSLLIILALGGMLCCFPASYIGGYLVDFIKSLFAIHTAEDGTVYIARDSFHAYNFWKYFIGVALVEESLKWIALIYLTKNNKNLNSLFDGMIYAIFVSLGFAALENVMYVIQNGWYVAFLRAFLSVPGHMFFAVMMGYHYSFWNIYDKAALIESDLIEQGAINTSSGLFSSKISMLNSLFVPVLAHGFYDFCCTINSITANILFYSFIVFLYFHCFKKIKKMSAADLPDNTYAWKMVFIKYPYLYQQYLHKHESQKEETALM